MDEWMDDDDDDKPQNRSNHKWLMIHFHIGVKVENVVLVLTDTEMSNLLSINQSGTSKNFLFNSVYVGYCRVLLSMKLVLYVYV